MMRVTNMARKLGRSLRNALRIDLRRIFAAGAAGAAIIAPLKKSFDFERLRVQFGILLGSLSEGEKRFAKIRDMSAVTPFQIEELAHASKQLEIMGLRGEENIKFLNLVGDAAAAMNPEMIQQVAFWMGRLNVEAQNQAVGRSTLRMLQLGVVSAATKMRLEEMATSGATLGEMLSVVETELRRFEGGMNILSKTGWGLFSTMRDVWNIVLADFGDAMSQDAKGAMEALITTMREMWRDGIIKKWAEAASNAVMILAGTIIHAVKGVKEAQEALGKLGKVITTSLVGGIFKALVKIAKIIGPILGNGIKAAFLDAMAEIFPAMRSKAEQSRAEFKRQLGFIESKIGVDDKGFIDRLNEVFEEFEQFRLEFPKVELPQLPEAPIPQEVIDKPEVDKNVSELQKIGANIIRGQLDPNKGGKFERIGMTVEQKKLSLYEQMVKRAEEQLAVQKQIRDQKNVGRF